MFNQTFVYTIHTFNFITACLHIWGKIMAAARQKQFLHPCFFYKLPTTLIHKSIADFQKTSEIAHLAETNRFFNHALWNTLQKKKETRKKEFDEAICFDNLFKDLIFCISSFEAQKVYRVRDLIHKFITNKNNDNDKYATLILAHAFDLDKKNETASQLGSYNAKKNWEPSISINNLSKHPVLLQIATWVPNMKVNNISSDQERLQIDKIKLPSTDVKHLAETYGQYYPNLDVRWSWRGQDEYGDISFNLKNFLEEVLPVILGLSPKPTPGSNLPTKLQAV